MQHMIAPDFTATLYAEAESFLAIALNSVGNDAASSFQSACSRYAEIIAVDPKQSAAQINWGYALTCMARDESLDRAAYLYSEAIQKYRLAIAIAPSPSAYHLWGDVLIRQGCSLYSGSQARQCFMEACDKFSTACQLEPNSFVAIRAWADALGCLAEESDDRDFGGMSAAFYRLSSDKYAEAAEIALRRCHAEQAVLMRYRFAEMAIMSFLDEVAVDATELLIEVCDALEVWIGSYPDDAHALRLWGTALGMRADSDETPHAVKMYRLACDKFEAAARIDTESGWELRNWLRVLMALVLLGPKKESYATLKECKTLLAQAEMQGQPVTYLWGCFSAVSGDDDACRRHLASARALGQLPDSEWLQQERLLARVREHKWFGEFLN